MIRYFMRGAQIFVDLFVLSAAYWTAFMLRFEFDPDFEYYKLLFFTWPYVVIFQYLVMALFGVPSFAWRYVGIREIQRILAAAGASAAVLAALRIGLAGVGGYSKFVVIPLGILGIDFVLVFMGIAGARVLRRITTEREEREKGNKEPVVSEKRTLFVGAGRAGVMVAREVRQNPHIGIKVVGFVDDEKGKIGTVIEGQKVLGAVSALPEIAAKHSVDQVVISIASAPRASIRKIVDICDSIPLPVKIIPGIYEILGGKVNLSRIREVTIEDLLGREVVELDVEKIARFIRGKRVLVTGAGGSIGSELCRQVNRFGPERLILIEQAENSLFHIHKEMVREFPDLDVAPCIADVCDAARIETIFREHRPHVVFHAAAHKHVPMMEWNPGEAIKNNVIGTKEVADAANRHACEAFVLISTDKAVNPSSIMGATKRIAEIYVQALSQRSKTKFSAVRFGNVLGSDGSVVPLFKEQIRRGGPVFITHPDMKRYFMTIPEACQLVMQAAAIGNGGEIFVLDMGEPVRISDLAKDLIRLSGLSEEEIRIEYTGARPGEKLFEEISVSGEKMTKTVHPKIFIGSIEPHPPEQIQNALNLLSEIADKGSPAEIRAALGRIVPEMRAAD